ncbi:MAG: Hpt domain-containing protein [Acidobacteriota bacterium]
MTRLTRYLELFLDSSREQMEIVETSLARLATDRHADTTPLRRAWHTLKGMASTMGFERLAATCQNAETHTDAAPGRAGRRRALEAAHGRVCRILAAIESTGTEPRDAGAGVDAARADATAGGTRDALALPTRVRVSTADLDHLLAEATDVDVILQALQRSRRDLPRRRGADPGGGLDAAIDRLARGVGRMRLRISRMRLLPFSLLLPGLEQTVGWAARRAGVQARLCVRGGDARLDRATLDLLMEPLVHLLRNAVSHGGEPAKTRRAACKAAALALHLEVRVRHPVLRLVLTDDGPGVDTAALGRRLDPVSAARLHDAGPGDDLADLLCQPGLSVRDHPGDLAGRGIGLYAVRAAIAGAGGRLRVTSAAGAGVRVEMVLPRTVLVTPCLLARCDSTVYGLPLSAVAGTDRGAAGCLVADDAGAWSWHGAAAPVPVTPLTVLLGAPPSWRPAGEVALIHLTPAGSPPVAVAVDHLAGRLDAVIRPFPGALAQGPCLGTALAGDGTPVAVLDPARLAVRTCPDGAAPRA